MNSLTSTARLPQIDLLRAIAVLMVIGNHAAICPPETNIFLNAFTTVWNRGGWTGVDLFFVLSGFLVSGLLFDEYRKSGGIDFKRFLIRRGLKIYPAFWLMLGVSLTILFASRETVYRGGFFSELLFVQNYHSGIWEHTWSLAVEEHFYIFLCLLFLIFLIVGGNRKQNSFEFIPRLFIFIAAACFALRVLTNIYFPFSYAALIEPTHLRIDSLFFGVFLSYLWRFRGLAENALLRKNKILIGLFGVACFVPAFVFELENAHWIAVVGLNFFYLGGGCLLLAMLYSDFKLNAFTQTLSRFGKYSYSVYLWNLPAHFWLAKYTNLAAENWYLYAFCYWGATLALGILTAKLIEYPILRLRDKIFPVPVAALKTA
jgi:peptidoglycan/LPS O-acetylase OafA/YrhL